MDKLLGGLVLNNLKLQGIVIVAKWIFHSLEVYEPGKILVRNNMQCGIPKNAKN